jgi:hypothetical protein
MAKKLLGLAKTCFQSLRRIDEMKKFIAIFVVLLLASPAMAAEWSFFGSQRMATFYIADDYGDAEVNGSGDDWGLRWDFQGNSRVGARVKADKVGGYIELALTATNGGDGGDGGVNTRRAFGTWKFSDNATLKVGKDYSPVTEFISGQVFDSDNGLLGSGNFYGRRPAGLFLEIGKLEMALLNNPTTTAGLNDTGEVANLNGIDPDWNLPRFEAAYTLKMDAFSLRPFGGIQYFKVDQGASLLTDDIDILSYVVGLGANFNIGAFRIGAMGAYGQNWGNTNSWAGGRWGQTYARATLDGTDDTNDAKSFQGMLNAGLKFSDTVNFEVGVGYRNDDADVSGVDNAEAWETYANVVLTLAPGVFLIPEAGYIYYGDDPVTDDDAGYRWYAGAKWQINF